MGDEDNEPDAGWEAAKEHGHDLADWIGEQENYSHDRFAGRDADGRFNRRLGTDALRPDDDD